MRLPSVHAAKEVPGSPSPSSSCWAPTGLKICWLVVGELDSELGVSGLGAVEERGKELQDMLG